jgi:hypothetical protein
VGRGHELAVLRAGAEAIGRGDGSVVWVDGISSALLHGELAAKRPEDLPG